MSRPLGVGIIGAGVISQTYLENLTSFPDVSVVAVGDLFADRAGFDVWLLSYSELLSLDNKALAANLIQSLPRWRKSTPA